LAYGVSFRSFEDTDFWYKWKYLYASFMARFSKPLNAGLTAVFVAEIEIGIASDQYD
jgi:hypothetical protein